MLWGYSSGAALATLLADESIDALVLTYPDFAALDGLPEEIRSDTVLPDSRSWPKTYLQIATHDEVVDGAHARTVAQGAEDLTIAEYVSRHRISTPEVARKRVQDIAEFISKIRA